MTLSYWRATFSSPPFNIEGADFLEDYYAIIDQIANNVDVKVIVFDSAAPDFWIAHFDILHTVPVEFTSSWYWDNITQLANLPVLTVAAIRGIARGGGAEIAASLDVRFKERGIFGHPEVGIGRSRNSQLY